MGKKVVARLCLYDEGNCFYRFGEITEDLSNEFIEEYHGDCFDLTLKELKEIRDDINKILMKELTREEAIKRRKK